MKKIVISVIFFLCFVGYPLYYARADSVGDKHNFYVDSSYDSTSRKSISAVLIKSSLRLNIYADESWWNFTSQESAQAALNALSLEFDNKIYPTLISTYGSEWSPGIDNDTKITILIQSMKSDAGGYFRTNDEYPKIQITDSNEREMFYINAKYVLDNNLKAFVAHEFTHLVIFNQKNKKYGFEEDTWLDEARAEYSPTLLGYNDNYLGSYLEKRVQYFSEKPTGSLIDWQNTNYDYAKVNLFAHYLVDQYGMNILIDSLHYPRAGIDSINYALQKNGFKDDFSQVFTNWTIAVLINDCNYGQRFCYLNAGLKDFYLVPQINFLPLMGNATLTMSDNAKSWSANWYKIIGGGEGVLKFYFEGESSVTFDATYITKDKSGTYIVKPLIIDKSGKADLYIQNFGTDITSLFVIPYLEGDDGGVSDNYFHSFFWSASMTRQDSNIEEINRLLAMIDSLKKQIAAILAQKQGDIGVQLGVPPGSCSQISSNLSFGSTGNEVICLQQFFKNQGTDIYPEGLVTGNFGSLTLQAAIRFQEKYAADILTPIGLSKGTGYVGIQTRTKINQILNGG